MRRNKTNLLVCLTQCHANIVVVIEMVVHLPAQETDLSPMRGHCHWLTSEQHVYAIVIIVAVVIVVVVGGIRRGGR